MSQLCSPQRLNLTGPDILEKAMAAACIQLYVFDLVYGGQGQLVLAFVHEHLPFPH